MCFVGNIFVVFFLGLLSGRLNGEGGWSSGLWCWIQSQYLQQDKVVSCIGLHGRYSVEVACITPL